MTSVWLRGHIKKTGYSFDLFSCSDSICHKRKDWKTVCEWYTIFNNGFMGTLEGKLAYFSGTIQWLQIEGRYIPDVYHTILHILILCALTGTIIYTVNNKKKG